MIFFEKIFTDFTAATNKIKFNKMNDLGVILLFLLVNY